MTEEEKLFKSLIDRIKADYSLTPVSRDVLELDKFSILERGDNYKISYCWEISPGLHLFSLNNSYRRTSVDPALGWPRTRWFKYLYCFLTLNTGLPDTMIRPNNVGEKIVNLFTHNHTRLPQRGRWEYLLESLSPDVLINKMTDEFLAEIQNFDELYVEIREGKCLLLHLRPANYEDTLKLIEVSKRLLVL
jgi:hypothetical protein